jgi:hypothetical protein
MPDRSRSMSFSPSIPSAVTAARRLSGRMSVGQKHGLDPVKCRHRDILTDELLIEARSVGEAGGGERVRVRQ